MTKTPLEDFLTGCVAADPDGEGLSVEELYGLYLSWCGLEGVAPVCDKEFSAGLRAAKVRTEHRGRRCPGLRMTGPAACDSLIHRELPLAELEPPVPERVAPPPGRPTGGVRGVAPAA